MVHPAGTAIDFSGECVRRRVNDQRRFSKAQDDHLSPFGGLSKEEE